jgi:hypothetical protein
MIFLIEYNRIEGKIVTLRNFDASHRLEAEDSRFGIELDLNRKGIEHEVVLLEAESEDALRRTHRRYFENLDQILEKLREPSLAARLQANGCSVPIAQFQDELEDLHSHLYQSWSVDELLLHPDDAKEFCDTIRRQTSFQGLPDDLILRCLISRRKKGKGVILECH